MHDASISAWIWFVGWLLAVLTLFGCALRLPVVMGGSARRRVGYAAASVVAGIGATLLAAVAVTLHDQHLDLTRERLYTPAAAALDLVASLTAPVRITFFYQAGDAQALRAREILATMDRRSAWLSVRAVDPDREPTLARMAGVKVYNAALIEAGDRRLLVQGTDETDIALGIRRVLQRDETRVCFMAGHNEYAADNYEFHTHLEGASAHSHDDASALLVQTTSHGVGRFRRSLEALGFVADEIILATGTAVPRACSLLVDAGPRTRYTPAETSALRAYLAAGGSALLLYDLGFPLDGPLVELLAELGIEIPQAVLVDPRSHYGSYQEMIAVTGYERHPITRHIAYTFYPGTRPLILQERGAAVRTVPIVTSGPDSRAQPLQADTEGVMAAPARMPVGTGGQAIAAASEGRIASATSAPFRAIVVGDADFASNSFYPYMSNSDLLLAMTRWLLREEGESTIKARIPVPAMILLTEPQLRAVLWGTAVGMPLAVVVIGAAVAWRRRR